MEINSIEKELLKMTVIKRNQRRVDFDCKRIALAIKKAFDSVDGIDGSRYTDKDVNKVYIAVLKDIYDNYLYIEEYPKIKIEKIQDIIEEKLKRLRYIKVYESFFNYRENRNKIRTIFEDRKKYKFLSVIDNLDVKKIIAGNTELEPKEKMKKLGLELAKHYALTNIVKRKFVEEHECGQIYIHDLEYIASGMTAFTQIDLRKIYKEGFKYENGIVRPANNILSYANICCNVMYLTSKEQYLGESIPAFDYFLAEGVLKTFKKQFKQTLLESFKITEHFDFLPINGIIREIDKLEEISFDISIFFKYFRQSIVLENILIKSYNLALEKTEKLTFKAMEAFLHNLNLLNINENKKMYFSINLGTDTTSQGRLVIKSIFKAINAGLGKGVIPRYPEIVFKLKKGINILETDPNYDLFKESLTLNLNNIKFSFQDATFNLKCNTGEILTEAAYINGIRVIENNLDDKRAIVAGRGLLGVVSINLVGLAIRHIKENKKYVKKEFFKKLDEELNSAKQVLFDRFEELSLKQRNEFPMLFNEGIWLDSDKIKEGDKLRRALKHGILAISFNGIYEMLLVLSKKEKIEDLDKSHKMALDIISYMRKKCDLFSNEYNLNYQLLALPEEYDPNIFTKLDLTIHGRIKEINDKKNYTNSFKLNEEITKKMLIEEILKWEAPFHKYTNAGHNFKLKLKQSTKENVDKNMKLILKILEYDIGFLEIEWI